MGFLRRRNARQRHADPVRSPHRRPIGGSASTTIGVSLDGISATATASRRKRGAFRRLDARQSACAASAASEVGVRYTMTEGNAHDLLALLKLVGDEHIDKFCFSHLNYAGRRRQGAVPAMPIIAPRARSHGAALFRDLSGPAPARNRQGFRHSSNDTDGPFLLHCVAISSRTGRARRMKLRQWGGNASPGERLQHRQPRHRARHRGGGMCRWATCASAPFGRIWNISPTRCSPGSGSIHALEGAAARYEISTSAAAARVMPRGQVTGMKSVGGRSPPASTTGRSGGGIPRTMALSAWSPRLLETHQQGVAW